MSFWLRCFACKENTINGCLKSRLNKYLPILVSVARLLNMLPFFLEITNFTLGLSSSINIDDEGALAVSKLLFTLASLVETLETKAVCALSSVYEDFFNFFRSASLP